ncbi:hypothetical protein ACSSVY_003982 [Roseovarius sp. MBR-51]
MREPLMPFDETTPPEPPVYIVMDSNLLIAEDLCGSLQAAGPCRVINASHPDELIRILEGETRVSAAFLEMRYDQVLDAGLDSALSLRGARIVLTMGEEDEIKVAKQGWAMLVRPFTEDMIRGVLRPMVKEV